MNEIKTLIQKLSLYCFCLTPCLTGLTAAIHGGIAYTGALVLKDAGYDHYSPKEAALSGIIGGAIIIMGLLILCTPCGIYNMSSQEDAEDNKGISSSAAATIFSAMAGWAILKSCGYDSEMTLGTITAASAVGFGVIFAALCCLICGCSTCTICISALTEKSEETPTPLSPIDAKMINISLDSELPFTQKNIKQPAQDGIEMTTTLTKATTIQV